MSFILKCLLKDVIELYLCFSYSIEYFEYDSMDYGNIYMNNLLKNITGCEDIWSNFQSTTECCERSAN